MTVALIIAYLVAVFLIGIGIILLLKPEVATGPRGLPLLRDASRPMMAALAAREIVLGLLAAGLAYTANWHGLLLAFLIALIVIVIDGFALHQTKSTFGFVVNDVVGLMVLLAAWELWRALGSI
jgi:hypothetical protein